MLAWVRLVPPDYHLELFGIRLVGLNGDNAKKLLLTLIVIAVAVLLGRLLKGLLNLIPGGRRNERIRFWSRQAVTIQVALILVGGLISVWFDDPGRAASFMCLLTAGLAVALQRCSTALAGYLLFLRWRTFNVGDRITMC